MEVQIPSSHVTPIRELAQLSTEQQNRLVDTLAAEPPRLNAVTLATAVASKAQLESSVVLGIVSMLPSMYQASRSPDSSAEEFSRDVVAAARSLLKSDLTEEQYERLGSILQRLLSLENTFGISAKGLSLLYDQERIYSESRLLTDIRPVFSDKIGEKPVALVIYHRLNIRFTSSGKSQHIEFALDLADVKALKIAAERAIDKEEAIRKTFSEGIPCLS